MGMGVPGKLGPGPVVHSPKVKVGAQVPIVRGPTVVVVVYCLIIKYITVTNSVAFISTVRSPTVRSPTVWVLTAQFAKNLW